MGRSPCTGSQTGGVSKVRALWCITLIGYFFPAYGENEDHTVTLVGPQTPVIAYAGPGPAEGSGAHRYVTLVYAEPDNFTVPATPAAGSGVGPFKYVHTDHHVNGRNSSAVLASLHTAMHPVLLLLLQAHTSRLK